MRYATLCSGIGAPETAWTPLGWECVFQAEIEPFPCAVLKHHNPNVPNYGDMTKYKEWPEHAVDLICAGTPCQAFSVAGLRKGLDDPRGNLTLVYLGVLAKYRPRWVVWENVPGVLSDKTGAFGAFLGGLAELGYGFAYRVLDAQFTRVESHPGAVPQRRRRVFVIGHLGDWRPAAAVLLERESLCGDSPPSRQARQVAPTIPSRSLGGGGLGTDFDCDGGLIPEVCSTLNTSMAKGKNGQDTGALVPVAFSCKDHGADAGDIAPTLRSMSHDGSHANGGGQVAIAFEPRFSRNGRGAPGEVVPPLKAQSGSTGKGDAAPCVASTTAVRRLTPRECERLQGFPDDYTLIPSRFIAKLGIEPDSENPKHWAADGPRYKALGNSMAVNVMAWIGQRIELCEEVLAEQASRLTA